MQKFQIWKTSGSWYMSQNALGQSNCRIFKSTISLEQSDENSQFLTWYKLMEIKNALKILKWAWSKMDVATQSQDSKPDFILRKNFRINWFLLYWYEFQKAKSYYNNVWVLVGNNGFLGLRTLKSAVFQEWIDGRSWFFACWYKFRKD